MKAFRKKYAKLLAWVLVFVLVVLGAAAYWIRLDYQHYRTRAVPILEYHAIGEHPDWPQNMTISKAKLEEHLKYFKSNGYKMLSLSQMADRFRNRESVDKCVVMTFDDGYVDNHTNAFPLLQKYNAKATFFIVQSKIGLPNYMGYQEIGQLINAGMEIGSHTINHQVLTDIEPKFLTWEIATSKFFIKKDFNGYYVAGLSYPCGKYNDEIVEMADRYGYQYAVTGEDGTTDFESFRKAPLLLGRVIVDTGNLPYLLHKIDQAYLMGYIKSKNISPKAFSFFRLLNL